MALSFRGSIPFSFLNKKKNFGKYVPLGTGFLFDSSTYLLRALNIFRLSAFGERFDRNRIREKEPQWLWEQINWILCAIFTARWFDPQISVKTNKLRPIPCIQKILFLFDGCCYPHSNMHMAASHLFTKQSVVIFQYAIRVLSVSIEWMVA